MDGAVITRRGLIASAAAASVIRPRPLRAVTTGVTPIFINWNPWYENTAIVTTQFHAQLSPNRWQFRAPFSCEVLGSDRITCVGSQATMDIEIQAAANAGIKAWMYVWYGGNASGPGDAAMHKGWQTYDSSTHKNTLKWCANIDIGALGNDPWSNTAAWHANCDFFVNHFKQSNYLKVGGRPVVFVNWQQSALSTHFANSTANTIAACNWLRSQSVAAGAGSPYLIAMQDLSGAVTTSQIKTWINGDAVSGYVASQALQFQALPETAATLYSRTQSHWGTQISAGDKTVPIAMLGWDSRPLIEMPEYSRGHIPWIGHNQYYTRGTNAEIANHMQACVDFIGANQPICDSKLMLVYAWNECCEPPAGSPPTTALLGAIKPVLTAAA
jgi:hypothetical protein